MGIMSTIRDVARIAEVSTATVSRVINSPEKVSRETRENVYQAMRLCHYTYNALARGFATRRSHSIGLIIPTITNPIFAESTRGIQDVADEYGYHVIIGNSDYQYKQEERLVAVLRERQVEGFMITTTDLRGKVISSLLHERFPLVLLYSTVRKGGISAVGVDNFKGGFRATEHLVSRGHRRIGMLAGKFSFSDRSYHRWYGYRNCLKKYGISYDPQLVVQSDYSLASGRNGAVRLMNLNNPPTAIFCANDYIALGAMEGARQMGLSLPDDLSIVGFDGIKIGSFITPNLTTILQPAYEMGKVGTQVLLNQIQQKIKKPVHILLETQLIERQSTTRPKASH